MGITSGDSTDGLDGMSQSGDLVSSFIKSLSSLEKIRNSLIGLDATSIFFFFSCLAIKSSMDIDSISPYSLDYLYPSHQTEQ